MNSVIYNPLEEYENKFKELHFGCVQSYFDNLVNISKVNIEENIETVKQYNTYKEDLSKMKKKYNLWRILRVLMCITLILIPLVILKITPKIKELREKITHADAMAEELLALANQQMQKLNNLFTERDAFNIVHATIPLLNFDECLSVDKEADLKINYDFSCLNEEQESTLDFISGDYNENPFLFENKIIHSMGTETYHGYKTISWVETYTDNNGKLQRRTKTEKLHATVVKPKPYYNTQVVLNYGSQGAPDLSFSRDATYLDRKSEKAIERYVKKGEKKLKRKTDKAIRNNDDFTSMSNSDFEVLFDALDRDNEVQFRTLFTPLAQTNMVDLILAKNGYGDDFGFVKQKRMNRICSKHSQGRPVKLMPEVYKSYSYEIAKSNFIEANTEFFKAIYFDFAPLLSIPAYQERPVHSLKPIPDYSQLYSTKESEALANMLNSRDVAHSKTKTPVILKTDYISTKDNLDETCVTAYSYDIEKRVDVVSVRGGDGKYHNVNVPWDEYLPLQAQNKFFVTTADSAKETEVMAIRNGLCIFKG